MLAIGVYCEDPAIYDKGIRYVKGDLTYFQSLGYSKNRLGNGAMEFAVPFVHSDELAQWQESGRDQGHTILGIGLMASICEIAWNQGDDIYSFDDSRFRKAAEYVAKYNLGEDVPFTSDVWYSGQSCNYNAIPSVSAAGRGELRPIWEMIYNHYNYRVGDGVSIPNITAMVELLRPEGGPGGHATTFDQPGFGTLTHSLIESELAINHVEKDKIVIFPNPATNQITIKLNSFNNEKINIRSIDGRLMLQFGLLSNTSIVDVSYLIPGIYFIELEINSAVQMLKLIIE